MAKKPKISIKKSKEGSFTAWCKSQGYGGVTRECIAAGLRSKSPAIRKKANFARNSRKWRKKEKGNSNMDIAAAIDKAAGGGGC